MHCTGHVAGLAICVGATIACGESKGGDCFAALEAPIIGGSATWPLAMASESEAIVIVLGLKADRVASLCSGFVVAEGILITAKHCVSEPSLEYKLVFGNTDVEDARQPSACEEGTAHFDAGGTHYVAVQNVVLHAIEDIAIVQFAAPNVPEPILWLSAYDNEISDHYVAGFGVDATDSAGTLHTAAVSIDEVTVRWVDVRVGGGGGACAGDSGGPLLAIVGGEPSACGVLSVGSRSCNGIDRYLRLDYVRDWIEQQASPMHWRGD